MKTTNGVFTLLHWPKSASPLILSLAGALLASPLQADVEIARRWAAVAPTINGVVSAGEWTMGTATTLAHGQMRTMNDGSYLYILLDVVDDTGNDPVPTSASALKGDFFELLFDKDRNYALTPNVDFSYSTCQDGRTFVKATRLSLGGSTG